MDNKIIKLEESGYTVELRGYLDTRTYREYNKKLLELTFGLPSEEQKKAGIAALLNGQEFVLERVLVELKDKDGNVVDDPYNAFMDLPSTDTQKVFPIVQEIIESSTLSGEVKKNGQKPVSGGSKG